MIASDIKAFGIGLAAVVTYMLIDYFVLDALSDKLAWEILWKRFYSDDIAQVSPEHQAMKQFEQNPSGQNFEQLQQNIRRSK